MLGGLRHLKRLLLGLSLRLMQERDEARKEVVAEIAISEAKATREAATILVEHRPTRDTIDRLDTGKF